MKELCVVHLIRASNGFEPFNIFLESYQKNPGGIEHDLVIIFKGFQEINEIEKYRSALAPFQHKVLIISDRGYDIGSYFFAFRIYSEQYRYFCFLNSFSIIQDKEWLKKLYQHISKPGVGLVGATGSWNSANLNARNWFANVFKNEIRDKVHTKNWEHKELQPQSDKFHHIVLAFLKASLNFFRRLYDKSFRLIHFGYFPNYHIRTNAYMISSDILKTIKCPLMRTKYNTHRFESGKNGLTMQILKMELRVLVVGKDGLGYEKETWNKSKTFWIADQENLLVTDNQTRKYQDGTEERRNYLSHLAWGVDYLINSKL